MYLFVLPCSGELMFCGEELGYGLFANMMTFADMLTFHQ